MAQNHTYDQRNMSMFVQKLFTMQKEMQDKINIKVNFGDVLAISELIEEIIDIGT